MIYPSTSQLRLQVSSLPSSSTRAISASLRFRPGREAAAFTLIELLIVIAIIAVLAGLGFGAVQGALGSAKRAQARNDVSQVAAAVKAYTLEYGRLPEEGNEIAALVGDNPKKIVFLEPRMAAGKPPKGGLSGEELLDPWGKPYKIFLDDDYDNKVSYLGEDFLTTVVVESQGDKKGTISNVRDGAKN
jgi:prepilin-type N-terminal cleavage/methylation domain-containing protein